MIQVDVQSGHLTIIAKGPQILVMGFEIFVLYIVNELYFRRFDQAGLLEQGRIRLEEKIHLVRRYCAQDQAESQENFLSKEVKEARRPFEFFDFGLRRRFSGAWHEEVVARLQQALPNQFKGSSNVYLAKKYGLVPIGTMAHEYLQAYQAFQVNLRDFQKQR